MIRYMFLAIAFVILVIVSTIHFYDYNYVERDYVFSRGHYMSSAYICDDGILYRRFVSAIFNKDGSNVSCSIVTMTPADRYSK